MSLKRKRVLLAVSVLLCIVTMLFASCVEGIGPANPLDNNNNQQQTGSAANSASNAAGNSSGTVSTAANGTKQQTNPVMSLLTTLAFPLLLVGAFYFILIRPQKKKEKQTTKMRNELQIGDEITTIGGIVGKIVQIRDQDQIVIETGAEKNKIRIKRWAIQEKNTISD